MTRVFTVLFILLTCSEARADDTDVLTVQLHFMSPGHDYKIPSVGKVRYFGLEEYKTLLKLDQAHFLALKNIEELKVNAAQYKELSEVNYALALTYEKERDTYKERWLRVEENWKKCEEALQKESSRIDWPSILIGSGIGLALGAVITTVIVVAVR